MIPTLTTKRHYYEVFPFVLFFRVMQDESLLEKHGISQEDWTEIKKSWINNHEDLEGDSFFGSKKDEFKSRARYNKLIFLKERSMISQEGLEDLYKKIRLKFHPKRADREKYLDQQIQKSKKAQEIYDGLKTKLGAEKLKELEQESEAFGVLQAYECLASLELAGASIPDYEAFTLGKYDAITAAIKKKNEKNGK